RRGGGGRSRPVREGCTRISAVRAGNRCSPTEAAHRSGTVRKSGAPGCLGCDRYCACACAGGNRGPATRIDSGSEVRRLNHWIAIGGEGSCRGGGTGGRSGPAGRGRPPRETGAVVGSG